MTCSEKKEARSVAASGVIQVVTPSWLEDCDREKKEIPIHKIHTAHSLILPRGLLLTHFIIIFNYVGHIPSIQDASRHINALFTLL